MFLFSRSAVSWFWELHGIPWLKVFEQIVSSAGAIYGFSNKWCFLRKEKRV